MSTPTPSPISWFEIPTDDLARAAGFYETVLGATLRRENMGLDMAVFPYTLGYPSGCLIADPDRRPGPSGHRVFFACDQAPGGLEGCLARVAAAGGAVVLGKTDIGQPGFIGLARDTEGNLVGLHARRPD